MCTVDKVEHLSQMLAENAVELHRLNAPDCPGINAFPCPVDPDHWHIGHDTKAHGDACKANQPRYYVPYARRMHKRKTHA